MVHCTMLPPRTGLQGRLARERCARDCRHVVGDAWHTSIGAAHLFVWLAGALLQQAAAALHLELRRRLLQLFL